MKYRVWIGVSILCVAGCATYQLQPQKTATYDLDRLRVVVSPQSEVDAVARSHGVEDPLRGLTLRELGIVMVRWSGEVDVQGHPVPDFEALGHEVWHRCKGQFH